MYSDNSTILQPLADEHWPTWAIEQSSDDLSAAKNRVILEHQKTLETLGNITLLRKKLPKRENGSFSTNPNLPHQARSTRFILQAAARELLPDKRVAACLRKPVPGHKHVDIRYDDEKRRAYYANLHTCKSIWQCPVCAARISEQRKDDLASGLEKSSYFAGMITLTLSHHKGQSLELVLGMLLKAQKRFTSGRAYQYLKDEFGIVGTLRGLETTHGKNGWHPHSHILFLTDQQPSSDFQRRLYVQVSLMWSRAVEAAGGYASLHHGVQVTFKDKTQLGDYVAKMDNSWTLADELTKAVAKRGREGGRTMTQLLYDYALKDDTEAGELWIEGVKTLKGKKHLSASFGFWDLIGVDHIADDDITEVDLNDLLMASLTLQQWRQVVKLKSRFEDYRGDVLHAASSGDISVLHAFLRSIGVEGEISVSEASGDDGLVLRAITDESYKRVDTFEALRAALDDKNIRVIDIPLNDIF